LHREVNDVICKFVQEQVAPEIITSLEAKKSQIIEAAIMAADQMAEDLAKGMAATLAERLGTSYSRAAIFKAMFGG